MTTSSELKPGQVRIWPVKSTLALRDRLNACTAPRLEERPGGWLRVVETAEESAAVSEAGTEGCPDIDESYVCPGDPRC